MAVITRKLHWAVKEIEPTEAEWFEGIMFLTQTGQACIVWRQEFILVSDVLGASIPVDAINKRKPLGASVSTVWGRFMCPIAGSKSNVWQANGERFYDVQQKGIQPDFNPRGVFRTGPDGRYGFRAVKPKFYPIPSRPMAQWANC